MALHPGRNRLRFRIAVLKQGLYVLKHALVHVGRLSLCLRACLPGDGGPPLDVLASTPALLPTLTDARPVPRSADAAIGSLDAGGERRTHHDSLACSKTLLVAGVLPVSAYLTQSHQHRGDKLLHCECISVLWLLCFA